MSCNKSNKTKINKNNSGWILCQSKSLPGHFYYYNVLNGEAVWSSNDAELENFKKGNTIHKVTDKSSSYHEPDTPPIDNLESSTSKIGQNSRQPELTDNTKNLCIQLQLPTFGQTPFPQTITNVEQFIPNIFWMPMTYPTPIYTNTGVKKPKLDQVTQTSEATELFVQTCGTPLCQRFVNYERPTINFETKNKVLNENMFSKYATSTPIKRADFKQFQIQNTEIPKYRHIQIQNPDGPTSKLCQIRNPQILKSKQFQNIDIPKKKHLLFEKQDISTSQQFQIQNPDGPTSKQFRIQQPDVLTSKQFQVQNNDISNRQFQIQKPNAPLCKRFQFQNPTNQMSKQFQNQNTMIPNSKSTFTESEYQSHSDVDIPNADRQNCVISTCEKVKNPETVDHHNKSIDLGDLEKNDLRYVLISKKRKNIHADDTDGIIKTKKTKINDFGAAETVKKKVSFDLSNLHQENTDFIEDYEEFAPDEDITEVISEVQENEMFDESQTDWCMVVDTDMLLESYQTLDDFVMLDKNWKLLIPYVVRSEIEALSMGECRGRQRVIVARHVARRLATPPQHYILEAAHPNAVGNKVSSILNCCINALSGGYHVILVSNDPQLHIKAKTHNIPCYTQEDVEIPTITTEPEASIELKKIKITIDNNSNASSNTKPFCIDIPVDTYKNQLFGKENYRQTDKKLTEITLHDRISVYTKENDEINVKTLNSNTVEPLFKKVTVNNVSNSNNNTGYSFEETIPNLNSNNNIFEIQKTVPNMNQFSSVLFKNTLPLSHSNEISMENTKKIKIIVDNINKSETTGNLQSANPSIAIKKPNSEFKTSNNRPVLNKSENIEMNIDNEINRFYVKNKVIDDKIRTRMDEWICTYTQIMEDALNDLLQNSGEPALSTLTPPWSIQEAITCINILYGDNTVTKIIGKLSELLSHCCCDKDKLNTDLETNVFMKILSCGLLLIQQLMKIVPDTEYLKDAEKSLNCLLEAMLHPEIPSIGLIETPVVCRSEVADMKDVIKKNYIKDTPYIIEYLKKHYKNWEKYELTLEDKTNLSNITELKVVRTLGKNLNMLKIDNNKSISLKTSIDNNKEKEDANKNIKASLNKDKETHRIVPCSTAGPLLKKTIANDNCNTQIKSKNDQTKSNNNTKVESHQKIFADKILPNKDTKKDLDEMELTDGNTFQQDKKTAGPKVIRNLKIIERYEENFSKQSLNMLDYSEIQDLCSDISDKSLNDIIIDDSKISCDSNNATDVSFNVIKKIHNKSNNDKCLVNDKDKSVNDTQYKSNNDIPNTSVNDTGHITTNDTNITNNKVNKTSPNFSKNMNSKIANIKQNVDKLCNDNDTDKYVNDSTVCTNDSGFENESIRAHSLVKLFLTELSGSFKIIYKFIVQFIKEVSKDLVDERKKTLHYKASRSLEDVGVIIQELKSIIERESREDSALKSLLVNAGVEAAADIRITRYRRVVTKCLEQAQILKNALKIIVAITDNNIDALSINTDSISSSIRYFNIFE